MIRSRERAVPAVSNHKIWGKRQERSIINGDFIKPLALHSSGAVHWGRYVFYAG